MISTKSSFRSSDSGKNMDKLFGSDSFTLTVSHFSIPVLSNSKELAKLQKSLHCLCLISVVLLEFGFHQAVTLDGLNSNPYLPNLLVGGRVGLRFSEKSWNRLRNSNPTLNQFGFSLSVG